MTRLEGWPEHLHAFIESRREAAFSWGATDCTLFAADAIQAMTGIDVAQEYRGKYKSQRGAIKIIKRLGGMATIGDRLFARIPLLMTGRGDLVLIDTVEGDAFGISLGRTIAAQGPDGVKFIDIALAKMAWRID